MTTKFSRNNNISEYNKTNNSFSGCDMVATITTTIGNKQVSRVVGEIQTLTYSTHNDKTPVRSIGNINAKDYVYGPRTIAGSLVFAVFDQHFAANTFIKETNKENKTNKAFNIIMDEIPPFDITITYANEYGHKARLAIYGVRIVDEGQTMSINDIYTENTYQYVATDLEYMRKNSANNSSSTYKYNNYSSNKIEDSKESKTVNKKIVLSESKIVESSNSDNNKSTVVAVNKNKNVINIKKEKK